MAAGAKPASEATARRNREAAAALPPGGERDFEEARRGLVASFEPATVNGADDRTVWDLESYDFLAAECPPTAHPGLWRQSRLNRIAGLFEIAPGFYQLRGFDLSNMHVIEGETGIVVIDPLISAESAAAALALYREHRGERPVTGLVYTHCHVDHFGGAKGIVSAAEVREREIPVLAPAGFLEHAVSENVFAGTAMGRRAAYMYGAKLRRGPDGQIGSGLGQTTSLGTVTLIPPNLEITATGQEEVVDGIRMVFQLTPGTEAPAEMNSHFPDEPDRARDRRAPGAGERVALSRLLPTAPCTHNVKAVYQRYMDWFDGTPPTSGSTPRPSRRAARSSTWAAPRRRPGATSS